MPVAFLPSPSTGVWQLGPIPVRAYALCLVAGILVAFWVADRRYRRAGGPRGLMLDVTTWAVPCGLIGARLYSVITDYELYFARGHGWQGMFAIWDGGLGIPGGLAAGALAAWAVCRWKRIAFGPVAGAAAPGMAFGLAIGAWGNWFSQQVYGHPSTLAVAVEIAPAHRVPGYESYATFQPLFAYVSVWDLVTGAMVIWAARRFRLAGGRVFATFGAIYAAGTYGTESLRIDVAHHILGLRVNQWVMLGVFAGSVGYLYLTRPQHGRGGPSVRGHPSWPRGARRGTEPLCPPRSPAGAGLA